MEEFDFYPQKPELIESQTKGGLGRTVFTLLLFVSTFLFVPEEYAGFVGLIITVVLVHELGHFLMMKFNGYKDVRMLFIPFLGALVHGKKDTYSQKQSLLVVLA